MASKVTFQPGIEVNPPSGLDDDIHKDLSKLDAWVDTSWRSDDLKRREVSDFGDQGFLLDGLMTASEIQCLIDQGEGLGFESHCVKTSYRNSGRIMFASKLLAKTLWERVMAHVTDIEIGDDPHEQHIHGPGFQLKGTWRPLGLNEVFRFCRYNPGGHFAPHFDGHFVKSFTVRSMKTLMIYLNGDFEGATTNFVDDSQQLFLDSEGRYCAEDKNILCRVKPEVGRVIIFNHHRLHEGSALRSGVKYILRTDVMYEHVGGPNMNAEDQEALLLIQQAERLEAHGDNMQAMHLYRKAFKLSPALEDSFNNPQ